MQESPAIVIERSEMGTHEGSKLAYLAAMIQGTLPVWPKAYVRLAGNGLLAGQAQERLERSLGVPRGAARVDQIHDGKHQDQIGASIVYFPATARTRTVWVEFKIDLDAIPVNVEFEVSPDGSYVEEVKLQFDRLKAVIRKHAFEGKVQNLKIGTKVEGVAGFDREVSDRIKESIKLKVKAALIADVRLPGTGRTINVQLTGGLIWKHEEGKTKLAGEGMLQLTVPFDFL